MGRQMNLSRHTRRFFMNMDAHIFDRMMRAQAATGHGSMTSAIEQACREWCDRILQYDAPQPTARPGRISLAIEPDSNITALVPEQEAIDTAAEEPNKSSIMDILEMS